MKYLDYFLQEEQDSCDIATLEGNEWFTCFLN